MSLTTPHLLRGILVHSKWLPLAGVAAARYMAGVLPWKAIILLAGHDEMTFR